MYAVIATGGKQYRVTEGQVLRLEKLTSEVGQQHEFEKVLLLSDGEKSTLGAPYIEGAKVHAEVVEHGRAAKVKILKFKRRKHHMKRMGHRQHYTAVRIKTIETK